MARAADCLRVTSRLVGRPLIVALGILSGCRLPNPEARATEPRPEAWCLSQVGLPGGYAAFVAPAVAIPLTGVAVRFTHVEGDESVYHDVFAPESGTLGVTATWEELADGTVLIAVPGSGPWYERTGLFVLLGRGSNDGDWGLRSCHLSWDADVVPLSAWCTIDGGALAIDVPTAERPGAFRVLFDLSANFATGSRPEDRYRFRVSGTAVARRVEPGAGVPAETVSRILAGAPR